MARSKYWMKFYYEMLDDPKIGKLSDHLFRLWVNLLLLAGELGEGGFLPKPDDIAWRLRPYELETLESDLSQLEYAKLLEFRDNRPFITKFAERQAHTDNATRQRQYRERKRKEAKEKEEERRKEEDIHTDIDKERYATRNAHVTDTLRVTPALRNVTARDDANASAGLTADERKKIQICNKLIRRWLGRCGQSKPSDNDHYKEHYVNPAWLLLEQVKWEDNKAYALLDSKRDEKIAQEGKYMTRISTLNRHIFGELRATELHEQGKTGEKAWYE